MGKTSPSVSSPLGNDEDTDWNETVQGGIRSLARLLFL